MIARITTAERFVKLAKEGGGGGTETASFLLSCETRIQYSDISSSPLFRTNGQGCIHNKDTKRLHRF